MLFMTCLFIGFGLVNAQIAKVTGVVTSEEDGLPVVGASVLVKGTAQGTVTDMDGKFELTNVPSSAKTLVISFIGMRTQEVAIKPNVIVVLKTDNEMLDEVVVTGYGTFKKSSFTGSASTMDTENLKDVPTVSVEDKLAGSVAGVQLNSLSGQPGAAVNIKIRGMGSINAGNNPLFVIDGVPMTSGNVAEFDYADAGTNLLATLNSNDIESMTVIKDAAAASLYGSRAANGVIVINTKKGSEGKTNINFKADWGFSNVAIDYRPTLDGDSRRELLHWGLENYASDNGMSASDATAFADKNIEAFAAKPANGWTNWKDLLIKNGGHQNYEVSASGGNAKTKYYSSLSYTKQDGVTLGAGLERMTGTINASHQAGNVKLEASSMFSKTNQQLSNEGTSFASPWMATSWTTSPSITAYEEDGSWSTWFPITSGTNPLQSLTYNYNKSNVTRSMNTLAATWNIWDNLNLRQSLSYDYINNSSDTFWDRRSGDGDDYNSLMQRVIATHERLNTQTQLTYAKTFNDVHNVDALLGFETEDYQYAWNYLSGYDYPGLKNELQNAGTRDAESGKDRSKMVSYLGRLNYNYADKYYVSASYRMDGTSRLSRDNRWGSFWSASGSWRFMQESFMEGIKDVITDGKLRASYGVNGTLPSSYYGYMTLYTYGWTYNGVSGMAEGNAGNLDLKWEKNKALNIGLDLTLLDRFSMTLDWYTRTSSDLLMSKPISYVPGFNSASALQNVGELKNSGIELELRSTNIDSKDWLWTTSFNIGHNKNKLVKLDGLQTQVIDGRLIHREGEAYNSFYLYEYAGVNPETGNEWYYINGDGADAREKTEDLTKVNKVIVGKPDPVVQGGLTNFVKWKFIDFNMTLTYSLGGEAFNSATWQNANGGNASYIYYGAVPAFYDIDKMWKQPGDNAVLPRFVYGNEYYTTQSSRWLMSTDHLRIKNLTVGFTVPTNWIKNAGLSKLRAFFAANNLLTWKSDDLIVDPETPANGLCTFEAPALRTFTFGVEVGF